MYDLNKVQKYLRRREDYYNNALKYVTKGNFSKASEFFWGAVTQSLKALAAMRGRAITTHRGFFDFTHLISEELKDEEFHKSFLFLNNLHKNFYDEYTDSKDFHIYHKEAELFMRRIEEILRRIEREDSLKNS